MDNVIRGFNLDDGIIQFHLGGPGLPPFEAAEARAVVRENENGTPVRCLCPADLLESKRRANRPVDQGDVLFLESI